MKILLDPLPSSGGGTMNVTPAAPNVAPASTAPFQMDGQMPDSMKGLTVDMGELESEVPSTPPVGEEPANPEGVKEALC